MWQPRERRRGEGGRERTRASWEDGRRGGEEGSQREEGRLEERSLERGDGRQEGRRETRSTRAGGISPSGRSAGSTKHPGGGGDYNH